MFWACTEYTLSCLGLSLFSLQAVWVDFSADVAKQWRKNSWGNSVSEKTIFALFLLYWRGFFFVFLYSFHAVQRNARMHDWTSTKREASQQQSTEVDSTKNERRLYH